MKPGSISFKGTSIDCVVLNTSTRGAGLLLENDVAVPYAFNLEISGEHIRHRCLIVWRNDRQVGVVFDLDQGHDSSQRKSPDALSATLEIEQ